MEKLIAILMFSILTSCSSSPKSSENNLMSEKIIGESIKIGKLEIAEHDFPEKMTWSYASIACRSLGDGWRLPTSDELNIIYQNKSSIGGLIDDYYWSIDAGTQVGDITFAFKTNLKTGENTLKDAWIDGDATYVIEGKTLYASPEDTMIQLGKKSLSEIPKRVFERKGTYRDFNFVRAVKSN